MPGGLERDAQRVGILHDAVVHQRHPGVAVAVRVRVALGGNPVGGPARVRDPARAEHRLALQMLGEPLHAPRELDDRHAGAVLDRNAGGVVAAILQATQTVHQNRRGLALPHVPDDATHVAGEQFKIEATISGPQSRRAPQPTAAASLQACWHITALHRTCCDARSRKRWDVKRLRPTARAPESCRSGFPCANVRLRLRLPSPSTFPRWPLGCSWPTDASAARAPGSWSGRSAPPGTPSSRPSRDPMRSSKRAARSLTPSSSTRRSPMAMPRACVAPCASIPISPPARRFSSPPPVRRDRKSTRLNSSHGYISYAVFCLK